MFKDLQESFPQYWTGIYSLFSQYFIINPEDVKTLNGLVGSEIILMIILVILMVTKK